MDASRKIVRRLIPFLMLCYFAAYLDRVNVGFAALTMNADLGLSAEMFGFGAGIFFAGVLTLILGHDRTAEAIDAGADQPSATARQRAI